MSVVLINIFTGHSKNQTELVKLFTRVIDDFAAMQPGFSDAALYRGLGGEHVTEIVVWDSEQDWRAARERSLVDNPHIDKARQLVVKGAPNLYELVHAR